MSEVVLQVENLSKEYRTGKGMLKNLSARDFIVDKVKQINPFLEYKPLVDNSTFWALKDVNFSVNQGDTIGIIGRNGAGKSTLLKVLSKITPPTKGTIRRKGRVTSLLEVGTGFHPELTGKENIFLNGAILGLTRKEIIRKFDEIVAFSGVEDFLDTPIKRYSSGMKVRLAFSVAAHLEPDILIIDEVLAVGDADFQKKCLQKMDAVSKSGRTILFVSHNNEHILKICKKGILLDAGKLIYQGEIGDVVQNYLKKSNSLAITPLRGRTDRKGNGELKVTQIKILNTEGKPIEFIGTGQDINIIFDYELSPKFDENNISIIVEVFNGLGIKVFRHSNKHNAIFFNREKIAGANQLHFSIRNFSFPAGEYSLSFIISGGKKEFDVVNDAVILKVDNAPFGENKRNPVMRNGTTLINGKWALKNHI